MSNQTNRTFTIKLQGALTEIQISHAWSSRSFVLNGLATKIDCQTQAAEIFITWPLGDLKKTEVSISGANSDLYQVLLSSRGASDNLRIDITMGSTANDCSWSLCRKCLGLFHPDSTGNLEAVIACPSGASHDGTGSVIYCLSYEQFSSFHGQDHWKECHKCQILYFGGHSFMGESSGACNVGGGHVNLTGSAYRLTHTRVSAPGQQNWRWCFKCQSLFFGGDKRSEQGCCPAGGMHSEDGSGNYVLFTKRWPRLM